MEVTKDIFFEHETSIINDKWKVDLSYESSSEKSKKLESLKDIKQIEVVENGEFYSAIKMDVTNENSLIKSCLLTGIDGAFILYPKSENENEGQSITIKDDNIILSLGFTIICINLNKLSVNWKLRPDMAEIFEFYDLERDLLLRGEIGIHRIDLNGNIKWTFSARDIWANMDGKEEVKIEDNGIRLVDFESNEYFINFDGEILEDKPIKVENIKARKWWRWKK
jgi:hypothetical protein